jgi:hypothetical protein
MGFKQLITKVQQAETALEAKERHASAQWDTIKAEWRAAWTPGRIVIAGLASGFVVGRAQPVKAAARSGQMMQMITMLSGLFAGGSAKAAADEAEHAAETAENVADAVAPGAAVAHPQARDGAMAGTRAAGAAPIHGGTPYSSTASSSTPSSSAPSGSTPSNTTPSGTASPRP